MPESPPPTPPPLPVLPYAARQSKPSRKRFSWGIFAWSGAIVGLWLLLLKLVLPHLQETLADFKTDLPFATRTIFSIGGITSNAIGLALAASIPVALGFIAGPLSPGAKRAFRTILTLLLGGLIALTVLAIFEPIARLMQNLTNVRQKS